MYLRRVASDRWPVWAMMARSETPAAAAAVARPARCEWPASRRKRNSGPGRNFKRAHLVHIPAVGEAVDARADQGSSRPQARSAIALVLPPCSTRFRCL